MALKGPIAEHFERQADACERLGSPFTARLCRLLVEILDETTRVGSRVSRWPGDARADALALRLCGGLHRLVLEVADSELIAAYPPHGISDDELVCVLRAALSRHDATLCTALGSPPQTNEIARSAMLLPGFLSIARETGMPLSLAEIGSSAGLNLLFDRFFYRYGEAEWGDASSSVHLVPQIRAGAPPLVGDLAIVARAGCDIAPIDAGRLEDRIRLRSYIWPDQPERLARLDGALAIAAEMSFSLKRADAADFIRDTFAGQSCGACRVLFHSIMWQYLPEAIRDDIQSAMNDAGARTSQDAPVAWLRMEPIDTRDAFATLSLTMWPGGGTRQLARCDYHGRWIEWLG